MFPFGRYRFSFLLLVFLVCYCDGNIFQKEIAHVRIINGLDGKTGMNLHCKSKDDDLGPHFVAAGKYYEFSFRPNFILNTLFFCKFQWGNESKWFDIYDEGRDFGRRDKGCFWMIYEPGPCLLDHAHTYTLCENWNKQLQGSGNNTARMYNDSKYLAADEKRGK